MRDLVILFIHFLTTLARLLGPGGVRSVVAESLLVKHQLLIVIGSANERRIYRRRTGSLPAGWRCGCVPVACSALPLC